MYSERSVSTRSPRLKGSLPQAFLQRILTGRAATLPATATCMVTGVDADAHRRFVGRRTFVATSKEPKEPRETKEPRERGETRKLPMMPIREMVIFPFMMTPFIVGRESSVRALEEALNGDRRIFLATQHDAAVDEPTADDIYMVGVIGNIVQSVRMPDGNIKVLVEGVERARASAVNDDDGFFVATVRTSRAELSPTPQTEQLVGRVHQLFEQYNKLQQSLNHETA